jgi:Flp pilus assembly protein CpaB
MILIGSLAYTISAPEPTTITAEASTITPIAKDIGIEVLVANKRIESGTRLSQELFRQEILNPNEVPFGAVLASSSKSIGNSFSKALIPAGSTLVASNVSDKPPVEELVIPPGYRAFTISVGKTQAVGGFASPNSRVDILWTYKDRTRTKKVASIVRFVKILALNGKRASKVNTKINGKSVAVTLLVTEKDSRRLALARQIGKLSLTLVGGVERQSLNDDYSPTTIKEILGPDYTEEQVEKARVTGRLYTHDRVTGKLILFEFSNGNWTRVRNS